jgi:hypothetical protein
MPMRVKLLLAVLFVAGIGAFAVAGLTRSGETPCREPAAVQQIFPSCDAAVLYQAPVGVDMSPGYRVELSINGVPIPDDEIGSGGGIGGDAERGVAQSRFIFVPGEGKAVERLLPQTNSATIRYWNLATGRGSASTFTWYFRAS